MTWENLGSDISELFSDQRVSTRELTRRVFSPESKAAWYQANKQYCNYVQRFYRLKKKRLCPEWVEKKRAYDRASKARRVAVKKLDQAWLENRRKTDRERYRRNKLNASKTADNNGDGEGGNRGMLKVSGSS